MIGARRHKISILSATRTADGGGGASETFVPFVDLWAEISKLSSTQDVLGERQRRLKRIAATIRARHDIDTGMRLAIDGDTFEITSIESGDDREKTLTLVCEEVVV